jgi:maleate cis-trans isomerase
MAETQTTYTWGFIGPGRGSDDGGGRERPVKLLPDSVKTVNVGLGIEDYTVEGVDAAIVRYPQCVDDLIKKGAQVTVIGGVPICSQLGRSRVLKLTEEAEKRTGVQADSTNEAIIAALERLGARRIAIASRWADQLNQAMTDYFAQAGMEAASLTTEGQWLQQANAMSLEGGIVLAIRLGREAMRKAGNADAILLPGGAWRSLAAVPILEDEFDIPVVTNELARTWRIIKAGYAPPVQGWGRLLANP